MKNIVLYAPPAAGKGTQCEMLKADYGYEVISMPADWSKGKDAGYIRNAEMGGVADLAVCFWNGESKGTKHMIDVMNELGKPVKVVKYA